MAQLEKLFVKTVFRNTGGFLATWPIGRQVKLGDIVSIRFRRMDYVGNLADPGIGIKVIPGNDITGDDLKWQSKNSVNVITKLAGEAPLPESRLTQADAGITIEFSKSGGFLFESKGIKYNRIENFVTVRKEAISKLTSTMFGVLKIYIIKEIGILDSYALTISQSNKSKLEVSAKGKVSISTKDLASLDLNLEIKKEELLDFNSIGTKGGAIFFKGERIILKPSKKDELVKEFPAFANASEDVLLSKINTKSVNSNNAKNYFSFVDINDDDIGQLLGDSEIA